ncbi:hypothetical protein DSM107003_20540 [Trichormus variabilis SAG 1403-4b]|uniref:Uncharacterized protein n=1 Tax=Trichormus variabilis SAG 1403-4b TaxID=447716 RepID=A0A433UTY2_ANAVA|nr:hypothetical protein DSM107003_20540 [Trichormus variabilis SAG 1403-4b]
MVKATIKLISESGFLGFENFQDVKMNIKINPDSDEERCLNQDKTDVFTLDN